ncbi:unnamed protein product [Amoebophrya sp. A25]|nr:unnamed protein product [Amoebophrya sp. A25]|eukprot:GSA25T00005413001.1
MIEIDVTMVDAASVSIFVHADEAGISVDESAADAERICASIRAADATACGLYEPWSASSARVIWVKRRPFQEVEGPQEGEPLLHACVSAPGRPRHHAFTGTGAANLAVAAAIPGTVVATALTRPLSSLHFRHPAGDMEVHAHVEPLAPSAQSDAANDQAQSWTARSTGFLRTARVLAHGDFFYGNSN